MTAYTWNRINLAVSQSDLSRMYCSNWVCFPWVPKIAESRSSTQPLSSSLMLRYNTSTSVYLSMSEHTQANSYSDTQTSNIRGHWDSTSPKFYSPAITRTQTHHCQDRQAHLDSDSQIMNLTRLIDTQTHTILTMRSSLELKLEKFFRRCIHAIQHSFIGLSFSRYEPVD